MIRPLRLSLLFAATVLAGCSAQPGEDPTVPVASASPVPESVTSEPAAPASTPPAKPKPAPIESDKIGGGCEAVKAAYLQRCNENPGQCKGKPGEETTASVYGAVLNKGSYLNRCGVPVTMEVTICAAVIDGHATGVTVTTTPHQSTIGTCVARAISDMAFPSSPTLDITRTSFAAQ